MARIFRRRPRLEAGEIHAGDLFDAALAELTDDGRDVLAVRFDWHGPLDPPGTQYLYWDGRAYTTLAPASLPLGEPTPLNPPGAPAR